MLILRRVCFLHLVCGVPVSQPFWVFTGRGQRQRTHWGHQSLNLLKAEVCRNPQTQSSLAKLDWECNHDHSCFSCSCPLIWPLQSLLRIGSIPTLGCLRDLLKSHKSFVKKRQTGPVAFQGNMFPSFSPCLD